MQAVIEGHLIKEGLCGLDIWTTSGVFNRKVASSNMTHLEAHAGFFRLFMQGILNPYVL